MRAKTMQRGDTLIEVLVAGAVFSLVAIGGLGLMNRGTNVAQRSLETTLVRQQLDAEAEAVRYIHDDYVSQYQDGKPDASYTDPASQWIAMKTRAKTQASNFQLTSCPTAPVTGSFVVDPATVKVATVAYTAADTYSQLRYNTSNVLDKVDGIWMEIVQSPSAQASQTVKYYDVHIRACWVGPDSTIATLGTIVRLYEPSI